jgi:hypothetical protein
MSLRARFAKQSPNDEEIASAEVRRLAMTFNILNRDSGCTLATNPV